MTVAQKLKKSYDTILVGYTPGALALGQALLTTGESFCIIDSSRQFVEPLKYFPSIQAPVYTDLGFQASNSLEDNPASDTSEIPYSLGQKTEVDGPPLSFVKGDFKSFIGFENRKIVAPEEYIRFCGKTLHFENQPESILSYLSEGLEEHIFADQQITSMDLDGHHLTQLGLYGNQTVKAKRFVFLNHLKWLVEELAQVETSISSRIKKVDWFSTIHLNFHHQLSDIPEKLEWNSPYLLMGSKDQPCLGSFRKLSGEHIISQWQTYIPAELTMDSETTGAAVKEIKKQVKRAFPSLFSKPPPEQIIIRQKDCADLRPVEEKLNNFSNLTVCSPQFAGRRGWFTDLEMAQQWIQENQVLPEVPQEPSTSPV